MSEIKKCRLDLDGTDHFYKCNHLMPLHFKGLTCVKKPMPMNLVYCTQSKIKNKWNFIECSRYEMYNKTYM